MLDILQQTVFKLKSLITVLDELGLDCPYSHEDVDELIADDCTLETKLQTLARLFDVVYDLVWRNFRN